MATNTIQTFFKKEIEPINNHPNNRTKKLRDIQVSANENLEINDQMKTIVKFKPECNEDGAEKILELDNNSNSKNTDVVEHYVVTSNENENYYNVDSIHELDNNKGENMFVKDINIDYDSSKVKPDIDIEIDTSIASKERKCAVVEINLEQIKQRLKNLKTQVSAKQKMKTRFYATIDPSKNQQAEHELSREISKDMFSHVSKSIFTNYYLYTCIYLILVYISLQMSIIGQFNLGFIITKLDADLFIVDQHATDEKYNFETLQKTTKITSQKLVV